MKRFVIALLLSVPLCAFTLPICATTLCVDASVAQSGAAALGEGVATADAANAVGIEFPGGRGSTFAIESIVQRTTITWEAETGLEYTVWWSPILDPPAWQEIGNVLARTHGPLPFFDTGTQRQMGFYRIEKARPLVFVPGSDGGGVDNDFYIGRYETTNAELAVFLSANPDYRYTLWKEFKGHAKIRRLDSKARYVFVPLPSWENHPVTHVSCEMAAAYCNWLSEREGLEKVYDESSGWTPDITKSGYRLPTAEEWYKAAAWDPTKDGVGGFWRYGCRSDSIRNTLANHKDGGDPFGPEGWDPPSPFFRDPGTTPVGYYNGSSYLLYRDAEASYSFTTEDGRSYYGCYDMSGNAAELVTLHEGDAWESAGMGSSWSQWPSSGWNLGDPIWVGPWPGGSASGFRIARTAP
jgi:sulfatase modifying factor 1